MTYKLIQGDCKSVLSEFEADSIDLTVTSPPYDNLRIYNGFSFTFDDFKVIAQQLYRVTKAGGVVVWVVGDATIKGSETGTSFRQALYFKECGFNLHDTMIWNKGSVRYPETTRYYPCWEYMFVFSKSSPKTVNLIRDKENKYAGSKVARARQIRTTDGKMIENSAFRIDKNREVKDTGVRFSLWNIPVSSSRGDKSALAHPATFPESLAHDHIISWSNEGDTVLDPFVGSGTTGKMAKLLNRNFIGIDISQEYLDIAKKRIEDATR